MKVGGRIAVPGDKSISHRALIFGALGEGTSRITGLLDSADVRSTAGVLASLGVAVPAVNPTEVVVTGVGARGLRVAAGDLDAGNRLEVAWLSGGVVELGRALGVPTPANRAVWDILALHANGRQA